MFDAGMGFDSVEATLCSYGKTAGRHGSLPDFSKHACETPLLAVLNG